MYIGARCLQAADRLETEVEVVVSNTMHQYVAYAKLITSTNCRCSDGTPLDGWHGVSGQCSGSSLCCMAVVGAVSQSVIH